MKMWWKTLGFTLFFLFSVCPAIYAETLEDQLNNLIGPKQQYNTYLSPVYLRNYDTQERVNPQSGDLTLTQTDYVLPGRNGLDLEFTRIYKSGNSNLQEMKVKYVNGAWVDYVESNAKTSSFYEDRYNLGIGVRFSFPSIEVRGNSDGTSHKFLHTESGDVYRLKAFLDNGEKLYLPEGQTVKDVTVKETNEFSNGQSDGASAYVMTGKDGKKTYFAEDGRILGIVDRYGNRIVFEYQELKYTIDGQEISKKLISKITDSVGRISTIEYKEDASFTVSPIAATGYGAEESYKQSQNPNNTDSGDLQGKFQVIVHLPGDKTIVYDKSAALVSPYKHVLRTRLQRVYDVDERPKYHFWYEQPDLGFTYMNGNTYAVYVRYEKLAQVDYVKTNRIKRYVYNTYTKGLNKGSMQYRKIFERQNLAKTGFDPAQTAFLDRFQTTVIDKDTYTYTNEADGYGFPGYLDGYDYLKDTYRYFTECVDLRGNHTKYTYDGLQELLVTEKLGTDHKEVITSERDEMMLPKKQQTESYRVVDGQPVGAPVKKIENYRYDEYGNLTNYTGPEAERDENGYPVNNEHTVTYAYAYDKFHVPTQKTWKQDQHTTNQIQYTVDDKGNVLRETRINGDNKDNWVVTDFAYDSYGNMVRKAAHTGGDDSQTFVTQYEYGTDADGTDVQGAYLTKQYQMVDGVESATRFAYDWNTGNRTAEIDPRGNRTTHEYDVLNRLVKTVRPDSSFQSYSYDEQPFANLKVQYQDPAQNRFEFEYDIRGSLVRSSVWNDGAWHALKTMEYDSAGNKTKETDANGHSTRFDYDSNNRLVSRSVWANDLVNKGTKTLEYVTGYDADTPLLVKITDEEGGVMRMFFDLLNRLIKVEASPDNERFYTSTYAYDYVGNKVAETNPRGYTTQFTYDSLGRLTLHRDALGFETTFSYNALNQAAEKQEPGGKTTSYLYNALGLVALRKTYRKGSADYTYTAYEYDVTGNVTRMTQGDVRSGADAMASDASYTYDALNRKTDEYDRMDENRVGHAHYEYDANGNRTQEVQYADAAESKYRIITNAYNYAGQLTEESGSYREANGTGGYSEYGAYRKVYVRDFAGNVLQQKTESGSGWDTTEYTYDHRNQVLVKKEPFNGQGSKETRYTYDKVGRQLTETQVIGGVPLTASYVYDGLGRLLKKIDPLGNMTRYVYDEAGNRIKEIDPRYMAQAEAEAPGTETEYDALNRPVKTVAFDGANREVTHFRMYDGRGNTVLEADGEGYNAAEPARSIGMEAAYDENDRKIAVTTAATAAFNQRNGTAYVSKTFAYDGAGHVVAETDVYGKTTRYAYFRNGLLQSVTYPDGSQERYDYDLTGKAEKLQIDRAGRETRTLMTVFDKPYRIEHPDGGVDKFTYSAKGELIESVDPLGNVKRNEYDAAGNLLAQEESIGISDGYQSFRRTEKSYDEAGRVLSSETFLVRKPVQPGLDTVRTSAGDRIEYTYDKAGRLASTAGPEGRETAQQFDAAGNLLAKRMKVDESYDNVQRFEYDTQSRMIRSSVLVPTSELSPDSLAGAAFDNEYADRVLATTSFEYTKNGKVKSKSDPKGNIIRIEYDDDGRPVKKIDPLQFVTEYAYDLKGRLAEEKNAKGVSVFYAYDELDRLIRKDSPASDGQRAVTRYIFDAVGNLVKQIAPNQYDASKDTPDTVMDLPGTAYAYDDMNRRILTVSPDGAALEHVQYDAKGQIRKVVDGLRFTGDMEGSPGTVLTYDGLGRVVAKTDALGNQTSYAYDALGHIIRQADARGNTTEYTYNGDGTLAAVAYPDGGTVAYAYDKLGRKVTETDPLGNTSEYRYNVFGQTKQAADPYGYTVETKVDLNGNPVQVKDKRGSVTLFRYDGDQRLTEKRTPLDLDASGSVIYAVESYQYDSLGNLLKKSLTGSKDHSFLRETSYTYTDNNLVQTVSDTGGGFVKNHYDKNGNVVKVEKLRDASEYDVEKYVYDLQNRVVKQIRLVDEEDLADAASWPNIQWLKDEEYPGKIQVITGFEYDVLGNRIKETDPRAYAYTLDDTEDRDLYATRYEYDVLNRVEKVIRKFGSGDVFKQYSYDEAGNRIVERNELGFDTTYTYDKMNRVDTMTNPEQHTLTFGYDLAGNKVTETNAKGQTMTYGYDKMNRLITVTDAYDKVISRSVFDANGNVVKKIDAKGVLSADTDEERYGWEYTYDLANRSVRVLDPELAAQNKPDTFTTVYRYNPAGEQVEVTNALGHTSRYEYDGAGRLIRVTDPLGIPVSYSYDKAGNKIDMTDGRGKVTVYIYGAFGLLRRVTNPLQKSIGYRYNLAFSVQEMTDYNGNHTVYTYDNRNLLLNKSVTETEDSIGYTYDEAGNRLSMTDESGTSSYTYDKNNQLLQIDKDGTRQIAYTYDSIGNIETVTDKTGFTTNNTYDKSNRMETVTAQGKITTYQYDDNGNRKAIVYSGGVTEEYAYDRNNRLVSLTNKAPDGSVISVYNYTYDDAGQQTSKTDSFGTTDYTYDDAGRILQVDAPGKTTAYAYDHAGNRQSLLETYTSAQPSGYVDPASKTDIPYLVKKSEYVYSQSNQLLKLVETMFDETGEQVLEKTTGYLYDDNGNELRQQVSYIHPHKRGMRQVTGGSLSGDEQTGAEMNVLIEKVSNTFDGFNRLKQTERIKDGQRVTVEYVYDGDDLRTRKTVRSSSEEYAAKVTNYLYDRQHVILETNEADAVQVRYVRGINYISRIDVADKWSYFLFNGHGDVVQTVSENGTVENRYEYDIFGNPTLSIESYENAIRYSGEFYDAESGLYYLRARYYNPYTGRFISEDSYWGEDTNPLSLNLYTYVLNNPLIYWDPTGHWEQTDEELSVEDQRQIKELTDAYYSADSDDERQQIHEEAESIRDNGSRRYDGGNSDSFANDVNDVTENSDHVDSNGDSYLTADEWQAISESHDRRSGGRNSVFEDSNNSVSFDVDDEIETIRDHAINNSDYRTGSAGYIEEIRIMAENNGDEDTLNFVAKDIRSHTSDKVSDEEVFDLHEAIGNLVTDTVAKPGDDQYSTEVQDKLAKLGQVSRESEILYVMGFMDWSDTWSIQGDAKDTADTIRWKEDHPVLHFIGEVALQISDDVFGNPNVAEAPSTHDPYENLGGRPEALNETESEYHAYIELVSYVNVRKTFKKAGSETIGIISSVLKKKGRKAEKAVSEGTGNRPPNLTPEGAGRNGAFREAKRNSDIPVSQQPEKVTPAVDRRGNRIPGKDYDFGNGKVIRDHSGGHEFPDDPSQNRGPHFNDVDGNHYDYDK